MAWAALIPLAMAAISAKTGADDRAEKRRYNNAMANASRWDYLTNKNSTAGMQPVTGSLFGDAMSGGMQGMSFMQAMDGAKK